MRTSPAVRLAWGWAACVLLLLPALAAAQPKAGHVVREHATLRDEQGQAVAYEIGTLYVPENRDQPDSRLIGVGYARIRALHPSDAPPIFWLSLADW